MKSLTEIKEQLEITQIAENYCELKKVNSNDYMAVINPLREERTSSLHFYIDTQRYYDYGTAEGGDIFDFISKVENIPLFKAIKRFKEESYTPSTKRPIVKLLTKTNTVTQISSEQLEIEFNKFEKPTFSNSKHKKEMLEIVPLWLYKEADKQDLELFRSITRYDAKNNTLVSGWYTNDLLKMELITYKRRRFMTGKWVNRKNTHPNQTVFNRIFDDTKPIYIVEGARDALTVTLLGMNFIAVPTTSFKNYELIQSLLKPEDKIIFIAEDMQGYTSFKYLASFIPSSKVLTFVQNKDEKVDLSDFVLRCNSIKEVLNAVV